MNAGTDDGAMPANVFVSIRPIVTAGLANDVDDVNQYAAAMYPATANGAAEARPERTTPRMTSTSPKVATISPSQIPLPERVCVDRVTGSRSNITLAMMQ